MNTLSSRSENGNISVITALAVTLLAGIGGVATIYVQATNAKEKLQASLDASVLAATAMATGTNDSKRIAMAKAVFRSNIRSAVKGGEADIAITELPSFLVNQTEVRGIAKGKVLNSLGAALGITQMNITIGATAKKMQSDPLCLLALSETREAAIQVYGNAHLTAHDCPVQSNSRDGEGMKLFGNQSSASASQFGVTGSYTGTNWTPRPQTGTEPVTDPFAGLPVPEPDACVDVSAKLKSKTFTLGPGTYCGGLAIGSGSVVTLSAGIYIMKDGPFSVGSGASVTGEDVMIALVGADSTLYLNSGSTTRLTSPQSGVYKNVQFMSDGDTSNSKQGEEWSTVLSGATLDYDGLMYLPEQQLWASGTGHEITIKANSPSLSMVVDTLWAQGNVNIAITQTDKRGIGDVVKAPRFAYGAMLSD